MKTMKFIQLGALLATLTLGFSAEAADPRRPAAKPAAKAQAADKSGTPRKKEINFEDRVIEGLGDRDYSKLDQTGSLEGQSRDRLYRKRAEFDEESQYLLREMEYLK